MVILRLVLKEDFMNKYINIVTCRISLKNNMLAISPSGEDFLTQVLG